MSSSSFAEKKGREYLPVNTGPTPSPEQREEGRRWVSHLALFAGVLLCLAAWNRPLHQQRRPLVVSSAFSDCPSQPEGKLSPLSQWPKHGLTANESLFYAHRLSKAVQIDTQSFDDLGRDSDPADDNADPRWLVHERFNKFLEEEFPLVYQYTTHDLVHVYGHIFTLPGTGPSSLRPVMFMAHQDTVPVALETLDKWSYPPFEGKIADGWIYGRGSVDCKNNLMGLMSALERLIRERLESGEDVRGERAVVFAFGFDEEMMGPKGAGSISSVLLDRYGPNGIAWIIDEGANGITEAYGTQITALGMSERGSLGMKLVVETPGGHASMPPRHTGLGILSLLIVALEANPPEPRFTSTSPLLKYYQCLSRYAPELPERIRRMALDPARWDELARELGDESDAMRAFVSTTLAVDIVNGGVKSNALPEISTAIIDSRIGFDDTVSLSQERVSSTLLPIARSLGLSFRAFNSTLFTPLTEAPYKGSVDLNFSGPNARREHARITRPDTAFWGLIVQTIKGVWGEQVVVAPGGMVAGTDTNWMKDLSENIVRWGPTTSSAAENVHTVDERITIEEDTESSSRATPEEKPTKRSKHGNGIHAACTRCHKKKRRCDRSLEGCSECKRVNVPCLYETLLKDDRDKALNRQLNDLRNLTYGLSQRVKWLEGLLIAAEPGLSHISTIATGSVPTLMTPLLRHAAVNSPIEAALPSRDGFPVAAASVPSTPPSRLPDELLPSSSSGVSSNASNNIIHNPVESSPSFDAGPSSTFGSPYHPSSIPFSHPLHNLQVSAPSPLASAINTTIASAGQSSTNGATTEIWPDLKTARMMADQFFQGYSYVYPVLDPDILMRELAHAINNSSPTTKTPPESVFRINMVFYLAGLTLEKKGQAPKGNAKVYRDRAFGAGMDTILCKEDLVCVQALVLLGMSALYETTHSLQAVLAIAARIAFSIGLHLKDDHDFTDVKKKTFWSLYNLDRVQAYALGKPVNIPDAFITVPLPKIPPTFSPSSVHPLAIMCHVSKARRLWGVILETLYVDGPPLSRPEQDELLNQLTKAVEEWKAETPPALSEFPNVGDNQNNQLIFDLKYVGMISAIRRPSVRIPNISPESLSILYRASKFSVDMFSDLQKRRHLNKTWSQLANASAACMSLLYCLTEYTSATAPPDLRVTRTEVVDEISRCRTLLNSFSNEDWDVTKKYRSILNVLSQVLLPVDGATRYFGAEDMGSGSVTSEDSPRTATLAQITSPTSAMMTVWADFDLGFGSPAQLPPPPQQQSDPMLSTIGSTGQNDWSLMSADLENFLSSLYTSAGDRHGQATLSPEESAIEAMIGLQESF